jgi:prolyl-tRNA editing enzyme YbaK/EbsC (Cys-tRNA(Pro) deacylase)
MIYPRRAKALHWIDPNTGEDRFSMGHEVGGISPLYFAEKCHVVIVDFERSLQGKWQRWINTGIYG